MRSRVAEFAPGTAQGGRLHLVPVCALRPGARRRPGHVPATFPGAGREAADFHGKRGGSTRLGSGAEPPSSRHWRALRSSWTRLSPAWNVHGCKGAHEGILFPGADDNASGTAVLLELARTFATREPRPKRSILFVAFSAEEMGLVGSRYFVGHLPAPIAEAVAMINLDMVGRLRESQGLSIEGMGTAREWHAILDRQNADHLRLRAAQTIVEDSDHAPFYLQNHPVLFFFPGNTRLSLPDRYSGSHPSRGTGRDRTPGLSGRPGDQKQQSAGAADLAKVAVVHPRAPWPVLVWAWSDYTSDGGLGVTDIMSGGSRLKRRGFCPAT